MGPEDWSCVSTVHPSSSSRKRPVSAHTRNQQTKGCRAEVCQAGQMRGWRKEAQGHWLCLGRVQKVLPGQRDTGPGQEPSLGSQKEV